MIHRFSSAKQSLPVILSPPRAHELAAEDEVDLDATKQTLR
ncbi:hypothetical protein [Thiocapsa rosea]|uniref:Uncharacterized protein n=1 Tax=Thiocapsa rosea TaxID=69360 RepID=A0A495VEE8_9GAMM|nr:hypothetical protein [Thiocapsa rosea]RKT46983.1 hypothetical protein BDD21_4529 [Thiocapsa rosea]